MLRIELQLAAQYCEDLVVVWILVFALVQKPLRRILIEEVGVDDRKEMQVFQQRLETETRDVVQRDLDTFDAKFASGGDATTLCTGVGLDGDRSSLAKSDIGRHQGGGEPISTPQSSDISDSFKTLSCGLSVPSGSFQLQADWKRLKNRPEEFYIYFKVTTIMLLLSLSVCL